jgi:uncharacterized protein YjbJ (UPF0337 family)
MGDRIQRAKGATKEAAGRMKRDAGEATGRPSTSARGAGKQVKGEAEKAVGKARSAAKTATR